MVGSMAMLVRQCHPLQCQLAKCFVVFEVVCRVYKVFYRVYQVLLLFVVVLLDWRSVTGQCVMVWAHFTRMSANFESHGQQTHCTADEPIEIPSKPEAC